MSRNKAWSVRIDCGECGFISRRVKAPTREKALLKGARRHKQKHPFLKRPHVHATDAKRRAS